MKNIIKAGRNFLGNYNDAIEFTHALQRWYNPVNSFCLLLYYDGLFLWSNLPLVGITVVAEIADDKMVNQLAIHEFAVLFYSLSKLVVL